jgi:hypothetical protein
LFLFIYKSFSVFLFFFLFFIFLWIPFLTLFFLFIFSFFLFNLFYVSFLFIYSFLLSTLFFPFFPFLYSFLFNIFSSLMFLLLEMRCKFVLARVINCSGYKYLVRAMITTCSDNTSVFVRDDIQNCSDYNRILF